jgi:hypothetical protein
MVVEEGGWGEDTARIDTSRHAGDLSLDTRQPERLEEWEDGNTNLSRLWGLAGRAAAEEEAAPGRN